MDISYLGGIILFIIAFLNLFFAFIIRSRGKNKITFHLGWVALISAIYAFTWGALYLFESNKAMWVRLTWLGIFILPAFLTFIYYFTGKTKNLKIKIFPWYLLAFILSFLALTTSCIINDNLLPEYPYVFAETAGPLNFLGRIFVISMIALILFLLFKEYQKSQKTRRLQIKYLIWGTVIYVLGGGLTAGLIPLFYDKSYGYVLPLSAFFSIFLVIFTFCAIFKKQLFDIKVILTELLVGVIGSILFIQILTANNFLAKIFNFLLFLLFAFIGHRLIKTTYSDIKKKEEAERLSEKLSELNLTLEDKIKERMAELEEERASLEIKVKARTQELQEFTKSLDEKVKERTGELQERINELEEFHKLTIGRELKMIELKEEIDKLKKELEENKKLIKI